jgi:hypothetical protein
VLLALALTVLIKTNMESGFVAFAIAMAVAILLSEINDGLVTIAIAALLIGNIIVSLTMNEKFALPWSHIAIIVITVVLIELLLSTTQYTALMDFITLITTILILILAPNFLIPQPTLSNEKLIYTPQIKIIKSTLQNKPIHTKSTKLIKPVKQSINQAKVKPVIKVAIKPAIKSVTTPIKKPMITQLTAKQIVTMEPIASALTNNEILPPTPELTNVQEGVAKRALSIAAMVIVYLLIL